MEVVLKMPFVTFSNADVSFLDKELTWRTYSVIVALFITKRVQIIDRKKFAKAVLDPNKKVFVMHIATITSGIIILLERKAQIALLKAKETSVSIPAEYLDFANVFSKKLAVVLLEYTKINTHAIDLKKGKQLPYGPIYSLGPVELETLKTYIETNLANGFICLFKSLADALILFD